ncbi:RNA-directed DNA polymerase, eukaryota, reverse transcriptase zinc-binding domain protein [Tanacetum coccineum]
MEMKTITLTDHELVHIINSLEVALVKVKSVETMHTLYRLSREEGFDSVKIHHIGGLWLWVQFETVDSCNAFKNNTMLKSLFTKIKPVSRNFCVKERMVWVEISGLPLCAWGSNAFKKIVVSVGKFMFFEDDKSAAMNSDSKVDIESNNEVDSENEGDLHGLFQEEQVETTENDKHDMEVNGESTYNNTVQEINVEKGNEVTLSEETVGSELSRPSGFENFKNTGSLSSDSSLQSKFSNIDGGSMKVLSINMRGTKKRTKRVWIKEICYKNNIQFLGVQESKMTRLELFRIKSMWGNYSFDYACSLSWGDLVGRDCDEKFYMIKHIGPIKERRKNFLVWYRLLEFIRNHEGQLVLFGDMNEVRDESERYGTVFSRVEAQMFNSFVDDAGLLDLLLGGRSFTLMNKVGTKMSKLDRFLLSNSVMDTFPDLKIIALPRGYSDHIPLMFHNEKVDYGPIPFVPKSLTYIRFYPK